MVERSTREHLINVGLQLMQRTSYAATGVKEVLDVAGVPKGSFYYYFPSKEAFGKAVLDAYLSSEADRAAAALKTSHMSPLERLRQYFEQLISIYGPHASSPGGCLLGNLSQEMANHSDVMQQALQVGFARWQKAIEEALQEAVARGEIAATTRVKELAGLMLNSYEGALLRAKAERNDTPLQAFLTHFFAPQPVSA